MLCLFPDAHDAVVRFNAAPTLGFEKDVGSKTTVRLINSQVRLQIKNHQIYCLNTGQF